MKDSRLALMGSLRAPDYAGLRPNMGGLDGKRITKNGRDDTPAVIFILALLATPLAIHVSSQLARGFYLWIYLVWKLERQQAKQVMLRR